MFKSFAYFYFLLKMPRVTLIVCTGYFNVVILCWLSRQKQQQKPSRRGSEYSSYYSNKSESDNSVNDRSLYMSATLTLPRGSHSEDISKIYEPFPMGKAIQSVVKLIEQPTRIESLFYRYESICNFLPQNVWEVRLCFVVFTPGSLQAYCRKRHLLYRLVALYQAGRLGFSFCLLSVLRHKYSLTTYRHMQQTVFGVCYNTGSAPQTLLFKSCQLTVFLYGLALVGTISSRGTGVSSELYLARTTEGSYFCKFCI